MVFRWRDNDPRRATSELIRALLPILFLVIAFTLSCWGRQEFEPTSLLGLGAVAFALLTNWRKSTPNSQGLQLTVTALLVVGWVMIERLEPAFAIRQAGWLWVAVIVRFVLLRIRPDYRKLEKMIVALGVAILGLQGAVFLAGTERHGAKNWIYLGPLSIQPGEFVKILFVLFLAAFFCKFRPWVRVAFARERSGLPHISVFGLALVALLVEATLVYQKDLGLALLVGFLFLSMFYVATGRVDLCGLAVGLGVIASWAAYMGFYHVRVRFDGWLHPFIDPKGAGYQSVQSLYALSSGSFLGRGLGLGEPWLVPEAATDFISVALVEELGLLGFLAVLMLLALLVCWAFVIALRCRDEFGAFVAAGLGASFAGQVLLVVGGCLRLLPLTGMTLPFLSYGGSSLLASMLAVTLLELIDIRGGNSRAR